MNWLLRIVNFSKVCRLEVMVAVQGFLNVGRGGRSRVENLYRMINKLNKSPKLKSLNCLHMCEL